MGDGLGRVGSPAAVGFTSPRFVVTSGCQVKLHFSRRRPSPPDERRPHNYILYILPSNAATVVASSVMRSPLRSCYLFLTCWAALCCGQTLIAEWDYTSTSVAATGGANRVSSSSVTCGVSGGCGITVPDYCGGGTASGYCMCVTAVAWVGPNRPIAKRKS